MLGKERKKLKDVDAFTILDYIKTSIEILMNMKMDESETAKPKKEPVLSDTESLRSMDDPPKDYEQMLQKYEAEVRNHIKIEQQLKLHIECVQDKLDDCEKQQGKWEKEKKQKDDENVKELMRYKDLLSLREKEVDTLKMELRRLQKNNEELR